MSDPAHVPAILQKPRRVRYLKIIALFKIFKGVLLFLLGFSLQYCYCSPIVLLSGSSISSSGVTNWKSTPRRNEN